MARVDFHSQVGDKLSYTSRLIRKISALATVSEPLKKIVVMGAAAELSQLSQMLWNFGEHEFLPHCYGDEETATFTPILLITKFNEEVFQDLPHQDVFIHLGQDFLQNIDQITTRFERVIEIVSLAEHDVVAGRERYKRYRSMGLELFNHDQKGAR